MEEGDGQERQKKTVVLRRIGGQGFFCRLPPFLGLISLASYYILTDSIDVKPPEHSRSLGQL